MKKELLDSKGFDLWADGYDQAVGISEEQNTYPFAGYKNVLGKIYQIIMGIANPTVLDIGFGTGTLTRKLYENNCVIYGQDFSSKMITIASKKMPNAHLYQGDFTEGLVEPLQHIKYDFIIATYSIHHLTDAQKITFLNELLNQLKYGGQILISDVMFETRDALIDCKKSFDDYWDESEIYCAVDELKVSFPKLQFKKLSFCSGVLTLLK